MVHGVLDRRVKPDIIYYLSGCVFKYFLRMESLRRVNNATNFELLTNLSNKNLVGYPIAAYLWFNYLLQRSSPKSMLLFPLFFKPPNIAEFRLSEKKGGRGHNSRNHSAIRGEKPQMQLFRQNRVKDMFLSPSFSVSLSLTDRASLNESKAAPVQNQRKRERKRESRPLESFPSLLLLTRALACSDMENKWIQRNCRAAAKRHKDLILQGIT